MKIKNILLCTLTLSLLACSEEMLTPTYGDNKPETFQRSSKGKTHADNPFSFVVGNWVDETGTTEVYIDNLGHFVMKQTNDHQAKEELGYLEDVSTSTKLEDLRFELYRNNKEKMHLAFSVREENQQRHLVLLDGSTVSVFRAM